MMSQRIYREIRNVRRDLAGIMQKAERIEAALGGLEEIMALNQQEL